MKAIVTIPVSSPVGFHGRKSCDTESMLDTIERFTVMRTHPRWFAQTCIPLDVDTKDWHVRRSASIWMRVLAAVLYGNYLLNIFCKIFRLAPHPVETCLTYSLTNRKAFQIPRKFDQVRLAMLTGVLNRVDVDSGVRNVLDK